MAWRRFHWPVLAFVLAILLGLFAYLARHAHPMADDFAYAQKDVSLGAWAAAQWEYQHWNGRYASNFLVLFGPMRGGFDAIGVYRLVPGLLLALTFVAAFILIHTLGRPGLSPAHAALVALLWTVLYAHLMPDLPEGFFWYTASVTYQLPNALSLIAVALLVRAARGRSPWPAVLVLPVLFFIVGCNEVIMLLFVLPVLVAAAAAMLWRSDHPRIPAWMLWSVVLVICCGAALVILAPGNAWRSARFPERHQLFHSLGMSALQTVRFSLEWISCPALVLLSVVWWMNHRTLAARHPLIASGFGLAPVTAILMLYGVIFLCVFPAYWSTGILGQHRTVNVACFFFLPLWFMTLSVFAARYAGTVLQMHDRDKPRLTAALSLLVVLDLCFTGNTGNAISDLATGRARRADEQLWARYELLREAAKGPDGTASIPLIQDPPKSLYVLDLRAPEFLVNYDYANWFGLKEVRIDSAQSVDAKATN